MGILSNMVKNKAKQKAKKHLKKGVFKVLGIIGFPVLIFSLIFVSFVAIASSSLQRSAAVFSLSENQENPEKENPGESNNLPSGKVNYVGVDDTDTPFSRDILREINRYSNSIWVIVRDFVGIPMREQVKNIVERAVHTHME